MKRSQINLTYGANVSYYTNFKGHRQSIDPAVGFRLAGFHLVNGYNLHTGDKHDEGGTPVEVNTLYISLQYYFPVQNKFIWDGKTMKKKKERRKAQEVRKKSGKRKEKMAKAGRLVFFSRRIKSSNW